MVYLTPKDALGLIPSLRGIILEVGFGNGSFLRWLWERYKWPVVGVDIANIAFDKAKSRLSGTDVLLVKSEARFFLRYMVAPGTLKEVYLLFPDPWPQNVKRRLVDDGFARLVSSRLCRGGRIYIATDHIEYASQIREVLSRYMRGMQWKLPVETKYMRKWKSIGRGYEGFCFENVDPCIEPFEKAVGEVFIKHRISSSEGTVVRESGAVVKLDAIYAGSQGEAVYKVVFSESGFSHRYFFIQKKDILCSLNTWGEVYPPSLPKLLKRL